MSIKGSPLSRFRRALATGNPTLVLAAAAELPRVGLADALSICLVLLDGGSRRFDRAAVRWHGRYCVESPGLEARDSGLVLAALGALAGPHADAAAAALHGVFDGRGQEDLARVVAGWRARRE